MLHFSTFTTKSININIYIQKLQATSICSGTAKCHIRQNTSLTAFKQVQLLSDPLNCGATHVDSISKRREAIYLYHLLWSWRVFSCGKALTKIELVCFLSSVGIWRRQMQFPVTPHDGSRLLAKVCLTQKLNPSPHFYPQWS